jgi:hypothetical protein
MIANSSVNFVAAQDNWDDDDIDDEFTQQLRAELMQNSGN